MTESVANTIQNGLNFLMESLTPNGLWQTFQSSQGESDTWVSAYVVREIGAILDQSGSLAPVAEQLLAAQSTDGGWGYKRNYVCDADSTATVCLALHQMGERFFPEYARVKAVQFLLSHLDTWDSGFRTFNFEALKEILPVETPRQVQGWIEPHVDVTGNVCKAIVDLGDEEARRSCGDLLSSILKRSAQAGPCESYWWSSDFVGTYYLILLRQALALSDGTDFLDAQVKALANEMSSDGVWTSPFSIGPCVFTTAIALRCLTSRTDDYEDMILRGKRNLVSLQRPDGSWESRPILVIPSPSALNKKEVSDWKIDIPGFPNVLSDKNRILVTAVALRTLHEIEVVGSIRRCRGG